jgi:hypothetical protein
MTEAQLVAMERSKLKHELNKRFLSPYFRGQFCELQALLEEEKPGGLLEVDKDLHPADQIVTELGELDRVAFRDEFERRLGIQ